MNEAARQPDLFSGAETPIEQDEERMRAIVRPRLAALLAQARAATKMPWNRQTAEVHAITFHNMANWLPEPERDSLRNAFNTEMQRLNLCG